MREMTAVEEVKAASLGPAAGNVDQHTEYKSLRPLSRGQLLEQAGSVLLLLQYPLTSPERTGFTALLDRRLRRAYSGAER